MNDTDITILESIQSFSERTIGFIKTNVLNVTAEFANYYIAVFLAPLAIYIIILAAKVMMQTSDMDSGAKFRHEMIRFFSLLMFVSLGYWVMPTIDQLGETFKKYTSRFSTDISNNANDVIGKDIVVDLEKLIGSEFSELRDHYESGSSLGWYTLKKGVWGFLGEWNANTASNKILTDMITESMLYVEARDIQKKVMDPNISASDKMSSVNEFQEKYTKYQRDKPMIEWTGTEIVVYILEIIGALITLLMTVFQLMLLALFKLGFPIACALSLLPTMEKTWQTWLQGYISIILLGVTMSLIQTLFSIISASAGIDPGTAVVTLFVTSIFLLISPAISVMLFGGSAAISGLPQQTMMAGGLIFKAGQGIYSMATKGGSFAFSPTGQSGGSTPGGSSSSGGVKDGPPPIA